MTSSHIVPVRPDGVGQVRQAPFEVLVFSTFMGTDWVLVHAGLLLLVAVKLTVKVLPAWAELGVNEKAPVAGSKLMFGTRPDAVSVSVPVAPLGLLAETVKWRVPPTVAVWLPGAVMSGK
jgi:hypothetical protein